MYAVKNDDSMLNIDKNIEKMIEYDLTRSEINVLTKGISTNFKQNTEAAYISNIGMDNINYNDVIIRRFYANEQLSSKATMCRFKDA